MPYRPTERTRARLAAARERIVSAALAQLAEGGYASASVVAVARRAGVATGTVYRHFPSKGDLFAEVFRRASQREVDVLRSMTDRSEPVTHRLAAWVEAFVRRALAEPVRAYALIAEPVDPAVEAERLTFRRVYADLFERALQDGMHAGELPPLDAELAATAIVGALAEALVGPLQRRPASPDGSSPAALPRAAPSPPASPSPRGADALVAGLQAFVLQSVGAHVHAHT
jgi:AcrR family transcriptional regulator